MIGPLLLCLVCLLLLTFSVRLFYQGVRKSGSERILERLGQGQPEGLPEKTRWTGLERAFLRAGWGAPRTAWVSGWRCGWCRC